MLGKLGHFKDNMNDELWSKVAAEAARTVPGRENGGNCDIKNLSRGAVAYFPVFVKDANLSMGDMHFSQGDGEVSFCGAIGELWTGFPRQQQRFFSIRLIPCLNLMFLTLWAFLLLLFNRNVRLPRAKV